MPSAKISITVTSDTLKWMRKRARRRGGNLSAAFEDAARELRRQEAGDAVTQYLGKAAKVSPARMREIEAEWEG
ncbi:MAG: ribbon-helix-helix protein, CopG family [Myxococcaceae bacterium]|nr:ribbon-helix-helix protein, CopG family [Myxococcaceae bacterium]